MRPTKKRVLLFITIYLAIYGVFLIYDYLRVPFDGLVAGWRYHRLMGMTALSGLVVLLLLRGFTSKSTFRQNIALSAATLLFLLLMLEATSWVVLKKGWLPAERPKHHLLNDARGLSVSRRPFWGYFDPHLAFWRLPQDTLTVEACNGETIYYKTNSYGARDKERTPHSTTGKRVVLLGDSFMEGYMVNTQQRVSDRLEDKTNVEHLNLGIVGTSPINYYLTYKHVGKQFEHDAVVVGILPANDFEDYTHKSRVGLIRTPIYRPYWDQQAKPYQLKYSLDSLGASAFSLNHYEEPARIHRTIDEVYRSLPASKKIHAIFMDNSYTYQLIKGLRKQRVVTVNKNYSRYNTYTDEEWDIFAHSLERLFEEAADKQILVMMYPILSEVEAYAETKENRIRSKIEALCNKYQVGFIDMLPYFYEYEGDWQDLYVPCDGHWSERGEEFVSQILYNHPLYQSLLK
ncbi:SGNH/GDSL hydrolase family protein [Telluribacter sp. SYSU D00476]|uniref:SGNH/GDSL hydrolase family protein n=1 Tax=Telluribacter sp. SYSU D00476 TaxID=2811430 RepID=UPI001FF439C7|nr:SGNH/GDSL hydrolase family protein [Telluribacter sp. SYSU D00476]